MIIEKMHMHNFRCFNELKIDFHPRLTVIISENGGGKTAILDAISIGLSVYLRGLGVGSIAAKDSDIRILAEEKQCNFLMLGWTVRSYGERIEWAGWRRRNTSITIEKVKKEISKEALDFFGLGLKQMKKFAERLVEKESDELAYILPVVAYYGPKRVIGEEVQRRVNFKKKFNRFDALDKALSPESQFRSAFEWFNAMEDMERREKQSRRDFDFRLEMLEIVRNAIIELLPAGFSKPRTEIRPLRFVIDRVGKNKEIQTLKISQLSDGYRAILGLAIDLARRMAQANHILGIKRREVKNPLSFPAIVIIDEIDLHLHPAWQQSVLQDLMRVFPRVQFIVTTHSPQVLSTVRRENIRVVETSDLGSSIAMPPLAMTYGEPSGDVLHSVMQVDPQPPVSERAILQRLTSLVDQGDAHLAEAVTLTSSLQKTLGHSHPQLQKLQRSIARQKTLKKYEKNS